MSLKNQYKSLFLLSLTAFIVIAGAANNAHSAVSQIPDMGRHARIAAHKAIYDIRLKGIKSGSQVVNISGQMLYEWQPSCDGWVANHRFNLFYEYADSPATRITSDFSTFEAFDGKSLDFTSQRKRDGQVFEELRGRADIGSDGKKSAAVYTLPDGLKFDLPEGALFPMIHTLEVLDAAAANKKIFHAVVFDGADEEGPVEINAVIGKQVDDIATQEFPKEVDKELLKSPAHKIRLAFFPMKDDTGISDYEMDIILHNNGIVSDMFIDYDDFSISQKLVALEPVKSGCTNENVNK